ncbi:hypothetical protein J4437_07765 [Candidatus Woesearchaeota archaeon]|nr:hypothetical protein [Candidatus Woesearchaeota archaeon]
MKISIDTHLDTPEDIHQAIALLAGIAERKRNGSSSNYTNSSYSSYSQSGNNPSATPPATNPTLMNMFSDDDSAKADPSPDLGSFFNSSKTQSEKKDDDDNDNVPSIEIF